MALPSLAVAFVLTLVLTPLARRLALWSGLVDRPNPRKIHPVPTPLLGGLVVYGAGAGTAILLSGFTPEAIGVVVGGALFLVIGFVDDLRHLGASKLIMEFAAAGLVVHVTGTGFHLPWMMAGTILTVLWIVGVVNAFNCLDCADGIASAAAVVAAGAFLAVAMLTNQRLEATLAAGTVGASLGFLLFNFPPARIFLGDAGSLTLGYLLAMMGVMLSPGVLSIPAVAMPAVVLAIPIYDIIYVHAMRYRDGERSLRGLLTSTGKDHLPHRLLGRGLSPRGVALAVLLGSAIAGAAGVALAAVNTLSGALIIGLVVVIALALLEREWVGGLPRADRLVPRFEARNPEGP